VPDRVAVDVLDRSSGASAAQFPGRLLDEGCEFALRVVVKGGIVGYRR